MIKERNADKICDQISADFAFAHICVTLLCHGRPEEGNRLIDFSRCGSTLTHVGGKKKPNTGEQKHGTNAFVHGCRRYKVEGIGVNCLILATHANPHLNKDARSAGL